MKAVVERLTDARELLNQVNVVLKHRGTALPVELLSHLQRLVDASARVDHFVGAARAREIARASLDGLETKTDERGMIPFNGCDVDYGHARFLLVQAYTSTTWAFADSVMSSVIGPLLCSRARVLQAKNPPQLHAQFVAEGGKSDVPYALFESIRERFGWSIAVSYAIRNLFVHELAYHDGADFFEGPSAATGFRVSTEGWARVMQRVAAQKLSPSHTRPGVLLSTPRDDVRIVFDVCDGEVEAALGVLVGSACHMLRGHVLCLLGEE